MFVKNLGCPVHFCIKRNFWGRVPTRFLHCKCIATFCYGLLTVPKGYYEVAFLGDLSKTYSIPIMNHYRGS